MKAARCWETCGPLRKHRVAAALACSVVGIAPVRQCLASAIAALSLRALQRIAASRRAAIAKARGRRATFHQSGSWDNSWFRWLRSESVESLHHNEGTVSRTCREPPSLRERLSPFPETCRPLLHAKLPST